MTDKVKKFFVPTIYAFITLLGVIWMARLVVLLRLGLMHEMFNELIMAVLCVLVYLLGQKLERMGNVNALLTEEVARLENVKAFVDAMREIVKQKEAGQADEQKAPESPSSEEAQGEAKPKEDTAL